MALTTNLISFWSLEETSGSRADSHGTNHLSDYNSVGFATGKVGNAADFEQGSSQALYIATNASLSVGDEDFSCACWVQLESKGGSFPAAVSKDLMSGNQRGWIIFYNTSTDRFGLFISLDGSSTSVFFDANTFGAPAIATWYFIVASYDALGNSASIYVNNGAGDSVTHAGGVFPNTANFGLGSTTDPAQFWDGLIDQVGFWKRVLTPAECTWLYNSGTGRSYAQILAESATETRTIAMSMVG